MPQQGPISPYVIEQALYGKKDPCEGLKCPSCKFDGPTRVVHAMSQMQILIMIVCLFVFFPAALIPLCCCSGMKDYIHRCGHCDVLIYHGKGDGSRNFKQQ